MWIFLKEAILVHRTDFFRLQSQRSSNFLPHRYNCQHPPNLHCQSFLQSYYLSNTFHRALSKVYSTRDPCKCQRLSSLRYPIFGQLDLLDYPKRSGGWYARYSTHGRHHIGESQCHNDYIHRPYHQRKWGTRDIYYTRSCQTDGEYLREPHHQGWWYRHPNKCGHVAYRIILNEETRYSAKNLLGLMVVLLIGII